MEITIPLLEFSDLDRECLVDRETFDEWVRSGAVINYDGHGRLATKDGVSDIIIKPSLWFWYQRSLLMFTHVCWYNK